MSVITFLRSAIRKMPRMLILGGSGMGFFIILLLLLTPTIDDISLEENGRTLPLQNIEVTSWSRSPFKIRFGLRTNMLQKHTLHATVKGCIQGFSVNGKEGVLPYPCTASGTGLMRQDIDLRPFIENGWNYVQVTLLTPKYLVGQPMKFSFLPSPFADRGFIVIRWLVLFILVSCTLLIVRTWITKDPWIVILLIVGVIIRWKYAFATDIEVRSYDWWGHIDYVRYLSNTWSIPPAAGGWEFQQPPLYYAIGALILKASTYLGWPQGFSLFWVQHCSLPLSVATLLTGTWIGTLLFKNDVRWTKYIFVSMIAALPGFVMVSSRLSNDALITPLIFLSCGMLLLWWKNPSWKLWIGIWIVASLAFLTKANGIGIVPGVILTAICQRKIGIGDRRVFCMSGILLFLIAVSWLPVARLHQSTADLRNYLATGTMTINPALRINHTVADFLTFNPIEVLKHPFINTYKDESRRKNFFEFLFRSALFGEFSHFKKPQFSISILLYALLLLPWMIWGMISEIRTKSECSLPFLLFSFSVLCTAIAYAMFSQFSHVQDFRLFLLLGLTSTFLMIRGIEKSPSIPQLAGIIISIFLSLLMGAFMFLQ